MPSETDRIVKTTLLRAPLERVWSAVSDAASFGAWFGAEFDAPFRAGARLTGRIRPTQVDPVVAALQAPHDGMLFVIHVEAVEPQRRFAFRWHPYAVDTAIDYTKEETTLVVMELSDVDGGTLLKVVESGFDGIPVARRAEALRMNTGGWEIQLGNIARHVAQSE